MPTFSIAATWQGRASADAAGKAVEALDSFFPQGNVKEISVGLGDETVSLHLLLTFSSYPHALIQKAGREITDSGGRFLELWRLPQEDRESFLTKNLVKVQKRPDFSSAAALLSDHMGKLTAGAPRKAPPAPAPKASAPREAPSDSLESAFRLEVGEAHSSESTEEEVFRVEVDGSRESAESSAEGDEEELEEVLDLEVVVGEEIEEDEDEVLATVPPAPSEPASSFARRSPRFDVHLDVDFKTELDFVREHAANISNGGMFIRTEKRPDVGTFVEVRVRLPNGDVLQSKARIAHSLDGPEGGVGIAFSSEDPTFQEALDRYLASLAGSA